MSDTVAVESLPGVLERVSYDARYTAGEGVGPLTVVDFLYRAVALDTV